MSMGSTGVQDTKEFPGEVALEAAADLRVRFAPCTACGDVGVGARAHPPPGEQDVVQCPIELSIAAPIETVTVGATAARRDRTDSGEGREGSLVPASAVMGPRRDQLAAADRADTENILESRGECLDESGQLLLVRRQGSCALADGDSQAARLLSPNLRFDVVAGASAAASDRAQSAFTHRGPRPLPVLVGAGEQSPQSVDLSSARDGQTDTSSPRGFTRSTGAVTMRTADDVMRAGGDTRAVRRQRFID